MARRAAVESERRGSSLPTTNTPRRGGGPASWPISRKLTALVALPTALLIGFIALLVAQSYVSWRDARANVRAADLVISANSAVNAIDTELVNTVDSLLRSPTAQAELPETRKRTDEQLAALDDAAANPNSQWPTTVHDQVDALSTAKVTLVTARQLADKAQLANDAQPANREVVAQAYDVTAQPLRNLVRSLSSELAAGSTGKQSGASASALVALSSASEAASQELALVSSALQRNANNNQAKAANIEQTLASQTLLLNQATAYASLDPDDQAITTKIARIQSLDAGLNTSRQSALAILRAPGSSQDQLTESTDREARVYSGRASERLSAIGDAVATTATLLQAQVSHDQRNALLRLVGLTGLGIGSLLMISLLVSSLGRTITGPMRRLRSGAVDAATVRLPAAVRQIEREGPDAVVAVPPVLPIEAGVGPETREVAQALDGLTGEAVRLATSQVRLRQSLDEAFVSMSRRSQAMVEKQLAIIDELESTEEDPEQLRNLFRLDHLAARMRRYNDNLLVLAGSAVRIRSTSPVAVADVFRAATSEMEQYERVRLQPLAGASVAGTAAGGLIHLLAELLDNAAMYSPPTSPIVLAASYQPDGGLRLEVTDSGVGIPTAELNDLNTRLATPATIDTQIPSRMGLFVVSRLAQRGGFTVRLAARAQAAGTVAEVMVPRNLVLGAPTGPIELPPLSGAGEVSRLPAQHGATNAPAEYDALGLRPTIDPLSPDQSSLSSSSPELASPVTSALPPTANIPVMGPEGLPVRPVKPVAPVARDAATEPSKDLGTALPSRQSDSGLPTRDPGATTRSAGTPPLTTPGGLPSRRPGAALSANPLGSNPLTPATAPPAATNQLPINRAAGGFAPPSDTSVAGQAASTPATASPFGEPPPWADQNRPRNAAAAGIDAARRLSNSAQPSGAAPSGLGSPLDSTTSALTPDPSSASAGSSLPQRRPGSSVTDRAPFSDGAAPTRGGNPFEPPTVRRPVDSRVNNTPPGRRPGARPLPVRAPGQPGSGPSAATAVAAAASARLRPISAVPNGLFGTSTASPAEALQKPTTPTEKPFGSNGSTPQALEGSGETPAGASGAAPSVEVPTAFAPPSESPLSDAALPVSGDSPSTMAVGSIEALAVTPELPNSTPASSESDSQMPFFEAEARAATASQYQPSDPATAGSGGEAFESPIFDSISVWFADENTAVARNRAGEPTQVIDLREGSSQSIPDGGTDAERLSRRTKGAATNGKSPAADNGTSAPGAAGRWSSLGDQRWIATNRQAAAAPETAGSTQTGLPLRRPGANLLPSATAAAGAPTSAVTPPARRTDAESVRGRLGSYQRGLSSARRARHLPPDSESSGIFQQGTDAGHDSARQGGDS